MQEKIKCYLVHKNTRTIQVLISSQEYPHDSSAINDKFQ